MHVLTRSTAISVYKMHSLISFKMNFRLLLQLGREFHSSLFSIKSVSISVNDQVGNCYQYRELLVSPWQSEICWRDAIHPVLSMSAEEIQPTTFQTISVPFSEVGIGLCVSNIIAYT